MENVTPKEFSDSDWKNRTLCSDGNCIGVIGPDGRCKECGKPCDDTAAHQITDQELETPNETIEDSGDDVPEENQDSAQDIDLESNLDEDWGNRTLCSDGNCIGVIGPDGLCKECGKPYEE
jgi:hypothetical protein